MTTRRSRYSTYIYVTQEATSDKDLANNKQVAQFHYFNPNGLESRRIYNNNLISELIEKGIVKSGYSLAYGWRSSTVYPDTLRGLAMKKRVNSRNLRVALDLLQKKVEEQERKIAEATA